jgi:hypothetical protein
MRVYRQAAPTALERPCRIGLIRDRNIEMPQQSSLGTTSLEQPVQDKIHAPAERHKPGIPYSHLAPAA